MDMQGIAQLVAQMEDSAAGDKASKHRQARTTHGIHPPDVEIMRPGRLADLWHMDMGLL